MKISLLELFEGHKSVMELNVDVQQDNKGWLGDDISIVSPIHFNGKIINQSGEIYISGEFSCDVRFTCNRCLDSFQRKICGNIHERLVSEDLAEPDSDEFYRIHNYSIDLREILENALILSLSIKVICNENCKGLCPGCGVNLNFDQCNCTKDKIDPRLVKLKELLQND